MTLALLLSLTGRALGGRSGPLLSMRSSGPRRLLLVVQRSSVPPVEPPVGDGGFPRKQPSRAPRLLIVPSERVRREPGDAPLTRGADLGARRGMRGRFLLCIENSNGTAGPRSRRGGVVPREVIAHALAIRGGNWGSQELNL